VCVGLDTHKAKIAVAVAEPGRAGEVRFHGEIANQPDTVRRLIEQLADKHGQGKRMNACSCALADEALEVDRVPPRALPAVLERGCGLGLVQQVQGHVPDHGHVLRRMAGAQA
jgi:hypothetical protein